MSSTLWIAIWWITEALPIAASSLLPLILFPLTGGLGINATASAYGDKIVFLFMGGFMIALAMERWNLHKRIALTIIVKVGTVPRKIVLGFMIATGFLSLWISNTATTLMMVPIALAVVIQLEGYFHKINPEMAGRFAVSLLLAIAYSASIGGLGTLVGTPTNAIFAAMVQNFYGVEVSFAGWFIFALPLTVILLGLCWLYLTHPLRTFTTGSGKGPIQDELKALGPITHPEKMVLLVFSLTAIAWITRSFVLELFIPEIDDTIIVMISTLVLFAIPARSEGKNLLDWEVTRKLPWGILLLFGGGLAIAAGFQASGLAEWIGSRLTAFSNWELFLLLLMIVALVNFLTEITSNVATATILLPVLASMADTTGIHPYLLMVGATLASSCAFMLPVATPPNAVIFGSGHVKMKHMVRTGFFLNLISIGLIVLFIYFVLPLVWDIQRYGRF
jgi:sodium-dependent dicarboxylate transporter 2/3/5